MNKFTVATLIGSAFILSSCDDEPLSCSNSAIVQMLAEQSRKLLVDQGLSNPKAQFGSVTRDDLSVEEIKTFKKEDRQSLCVAKIHIKFDPNITTSNSPDSKSSPGREVHYAAQESPDRKEYRVTVLSIR